MTQALTIKQVELLTVIASGDIDGNACDLDQILDAVRYETTKQSLQFSLRALIARGLIAKKGVEKRRGRQRQVIVATTEGKNVVRYDMKNSTPGFIASVEEDEIDVISECY